MLEINDTINLTSINGVTAKKILDVDAKEVLLINIEKDAIFDKHSSKSDATLLILEGCISFYIDNSEFKLSENQIFNFPKNKEHWVEARENSRFLIIR